jgi:hypothetical protein
MALIFAYQNRNCTRDITIRNAADAVITPSTYDQVRAMIGREGYVPELTVASDAPTSNGSTFTKNHPSSGVNRLRLDAQDLDFEPGVYTLFLDYFDHADAEDWKNVDRQVFCLERT